MLIVMLPIRPLTEIHLDGPLGCFLMTRLMADPLAWFTVPRGVNLIVFPVIRKLELGEMLVMSMLLRGVLLRQVVGLLI